MYPVNMLFYSLYLNAIKQTIRSEIADGTSKLTIAQDDLANYMIEYIPIEVQNKIAEEYEKKVINPLQKIKQTEQDIFAQVKEL